MASLCWTSDIASFLRLKSPSSAQALAMIGVGMSHADAEVLYSICDPEGKEGMDYNEFTAVSYVY